MNRPFNRQPGAGFGHQQNSRLPVRGGRQGGELREPEERAPGTVTIWAHDLTVKPGATYRYRLRAGAMNPFFLREKILVEGQKPLAKQLTLVSAPSKWTEAISIHRKTYFFLVDGSRRDDEGRMELYRRFDGSWRRQELEVRPGEPIGGMHRLASERFELDVDLSVGAIVVDLNEVPAARHKARMTKRMLYLDTDSQSLQQRTAEQDGADEIRVHLFNQVKLDDQLAAMER